MVLRVFEENNSNFPITREFFFFSFALFFLAYWVFLNSSFDALSILSIFPALVLAFGSSILLYAFFSVAGWAPPLLGYFKFLKVLETSTPKIKAGGVGGFLLVASNSGSKEKKAVKVTPREKKTGHRNTALKSLKLENTKTSGVKPS